jgi:hypothetical protein
VGLLRFPAIAEEDEAHHILRGGFTPEESGKIAGGNYMRIFRAPVG